jgi:hypothetical protein
VFPAVTDHLGEARRVAAQVAADLTDRGARAVVLVGSVARGDALPTSDIDLVALGPGPARHLTLRGGRQVSASWRTPEQVRDSHCSPADAGGAVPAWREGVILADTDGEAGRLQAEARHWSWSLIDRAADAWVAEQVTGYAEDVHRLIGQAAHGSPRTAAVIRCRLAVRMAIVLAVHHRILYDSENRLWDLVAEVEGEHWTAAQDAALGLDGSADRAAVELYVATARRTAHLLDADQSAVVRQALALCAAS